jgi:hypothetical protein
LVEKRDDQEHNGNAEEGGKNFHGAVGILRRCLAARAGGG